MRRERTNVEKRVLQMFVADVPKRITSEMYRLSTSRSSVKFMPVKLCAYIHKDNWCLCRSTVFPAVLPTVLLDLLQQQSAWSNSCSFCRTYLTYVQNVQNASHPWHSGYAEHKLLHYVVKLCVQDAGFIFLVRRVRKVAKSDWYLLYVCLSVRMEELGSHWKDFHEAWYLGIFRKSVEEIQVPSKSDNNQYFTWRPMYIVYNISLNYS